MGLPVVEMMERVPAREMDDWMRYAQIEPFGQPRTDLMIGVLASLLANLNSNEESRPRDELGMSRPFAPIDFIPGLSEPVAELSVKEQAAKAETREAAAERLYAEKMRARKKAS